MKISVITAVLNGAKTVRATVDSVAAQEHPDVEHIVVDGGSTDGTVEIVRSCEGRVGRIISGTDLGVYDAINKGILASSGEAIICLNSGDIYTSTKALTVLGSALQEFQVNVVFGNLLMTDPANTSRVLRKYIARGFSPADLLSGLMPPHPTLMVRREVHNLVGLYDPSYRIAGDFDLCLRIFLGQKLGFAHVNEFLVNMPVGGMSNGSWNSVLRNTNEMHRACRSNGFSPGWVRLASRVLVKWWMGRRSG